MSAATGALEIYQDHRGIMGVPIAKVILQSSFRKLPYFVASLDRRLTKNWVTHRRTLTRNAAKHLLNDMTYMSNRQPASEAAKTSKQASEQRFLQTVNKRTNKKTNRQADR